MAAETRPIAVKTEAAMYAALAGIVAMMAFMAIGGSGFFMAGFRGLLAALVVFVALLALLPPPAEAQTETPADPEAEAAEPAAAAVDAGSMEAAPEVAVTDMPAAVPAPSPEPEPTLAADAPTIPPEPVAPVAASEPAPDAAIPASDATVAEPAPDGNGEPAAIAPVAEPARPAALASPRGGAADDLKRIRGVGPKLEKALNAAGFWHFDQIAGWSAAELAWVDEQVQGVRGRATRDDWVGQAKRLAPSAAPVAG